MNNDNINLLGERGATQERLRNFFGQSQSNFDRHVELSLDMINSRKPPIAKFSSLKGVAGSSLTPNTLAAAICYVNTDGELEVTCMSNEVLTVASTVAMFGSCRAWSMAGITIDQTSNGVELVTALKAVPMSKNGCAKLAISCVTHAIPDEKPTLFF